MTQPLFIPLSKGENAVLVTHDGKLAKGFVNHPEDLTENGDAIQDLMIRMLKDEEAKEGFWIWKIYDNWTSISGCPVELEIS